MLTLRLRQQAAVALAMFAVTLGTPAISRGQDSDIDLSALEPLIEALGDLDGLLDSETLPADTSDPDSTFDSPDTTDRSPIVDELRSLLGTRTRDRSSSRSSVRRTYTGPRLIGNGTQRIGPFTLIGGGQIIPEPKPYYQETQAELLAKARAALAGGDPLAAHMILRQAGGGHDPAVAGLRGQITLAAHNELARASRLAEAGRPLEALNTCRRFARGFKGSLTGQLAREQWLSIENSPQTEIAIQQRRAERLWRTLVDRLCAKPSDVTEPNCDELFKRISAMNQTSQVQAFRIVRTLATKYAKCPAGRQAMELHVLLVADTDIPGKVEAWESARRARRLYQKARTYHLAGLHARAAEFYRDYLRAYPEDKNSRQAKKYLRLLEASPLAMSQT